MKTRRPPQHVLENPLAEAASYQYIATMRQPRRRLSEVFSALNWRYFDGQLPHYRVRRARLADPDMDEMRRELRRLRGQRPWRPRRRWADLLGDCHVAARCIRVSDALSSEDERRVLLHEMCHAATPGDGHGRHWCREMRRLAKLGEVWAAEEAADYDQGNGGN